MPDLHGWIVQQIDRVEQTARAVEDRSAPWDGQWVADGPDALRTYNGHVLFYGHNWPLKPGLVNHVALHDPAAVLRRCAADRKILAEHRPMGGGYPRHYACEGCGYDGGYCPEPITEHVNDCPTLLALAEGYGLTEEQRAQLDRPEVERPEPSGRSLIPDAIAEGMYGQLWAHVLGTRLVEPRPEVKAMEILEPELKKISDYVPTSEEQP